MKRIENGEVEYEVYSLYPPKKNTEDYSCEQRNDCLKCSKLCEIGLLNYEIHYEDVGA